MDIVKTKSKKTRIHFFRNTKHPDWYFIKHFSDERAESFYLCVRHLPPHEESGYMDLDIEWGFAIECEDADDHTYLNFIKNNIGIYREDEDPCITHWIGTNGWFEITDISNRDEWLNDYYNFQRQQQLELQNAIRKGEQIVLF